MIGEQFISASSLGLEGRHEYSIVNSSDALRRGSESLDARCELPLVFSEKRGDMPILTTENNLQTDSVYIVANSTAQFMNSTQYPHRDREKEFREIVDHNAISIGPTMLAYTRKDDNFVYMTNHEIESMKVLQTTSDSFQRVGIELAQDFWPVASIDEWMNKYAGHVNILPQVLDPELLLKYAPRGREKAIKNIALANVSAYTKNGVQQLWAKYGIPTPETAYYNLGFISEQDVDADASELFQSYERVVIKRIDRFGGYANFFVQKSEIAQTLKSEALLHQRIQIQGMLPVISSPGYVANIYPDGHIQPLSVSRQIFAEPGEHAGNYWKRNYDFRQLAPDFEETNLEALYTLASAGVIGQVSIDSMIIKEEDAQRYGVPTTTMSEANIRPGGSSIINRLKQGNINGRSIDTILTSTKVYIPQEHFFKKGILDYVNTFTTNNTEVVIYNYNLETNLASIAFTGTEETTEIDLLNLKQHTLTLFA